MAYTIEHTLPSHEEVLSKLPLSESLSKKIKKDRTEIQNILQGKDTRKIMIIGPCSAWPEEAVVAYAKKLAPLAEELNDVLKIVMRTYIQKPRTTVGWMGPLVQPNPCEKPHIPNGIFYCRKMMLEVLELGLPIADEILFPRYQSYYRDLLSWAAIGARSSENQEHRVLSSLLEFPIGVKNPTSGNIDTGGNSVLACQTPNYLALAGNQVKTSGNAYAHLVLRGGNNKPNISLKHLQSAQAILTEKNIKNPSIIVDISHDNTRNEEGLKDYLRQTNVLADTLQSMNQHETIHQSVKGWMCESFLEAGKQKINTQEPQNILFGQSITDGCLSWEQTEVLLKDLAQKLRK